MPTSCGLIRSIIRQCWRKAWEFSRQPESMSPCTIHRQKGVQNHRPRWTRGNPCQYARSELAIAAEDGRSGSEELPFTNYTIFRGIGFGLGEVVTGWNYDLSDTQRPKNQFCYYRQSLDKGISAKYIIAVDGYPRRPSPLAKLRFNFDEAVQSCMWFSGL
jgi:hypothetical protein